MTAARRRVLVPVLAVGAGLAIGAVAVTALVTANVARRVVTPARAFVYDIPIVSVARDHSTITLGVTKESVVPGRYSLWFSGDSGHLRIGEILDRTPTTVTRAIDAVGFGDLDGASRSRISGWYYLRPEELGLAVEAVDIPTDRGSAPAWFFPANDATRWAILVHGRGTRRQETLRAVPVFHENGYNALAVSYRNDGDAPLSEDGRYGLGSTEWRDVDAAIGYALANGAEEIILAGWSMGGAISLQTVTRSEHSASISGLVLDSPVVDWVDTLRYQANALRLPGGLTRAAFAVLAAPWGGRLTGLGAPIDLSTMDFVARADQLSTPIMLMHSDDDGFVPPTGSRALAAARPDIVTFVPFDTATHTKLWNYDTALWNKTVGDWLALRNAATERS
jgi:pimeloyl-ACP methyl ester carboxylesterase